MLVVKVELHSANTEKITLLGSMVIANIGGTHHRGKYAGVMYRKGVEPPGLDSTTNRDGEKGRQRSARVDDYPRISKPVWCLVKQMLDNMGF